MQNKNDHLCKNVVTQSWGLLSSCFFFYSAAQCVNHALRERQILLRRFPLRRCWEEVWVNWTIYYRSWMPPSSTSQVCAVSVSVLAYSPVPLFLFNLVLFLYHQMRSWLNSPPKKMRRRRLRRRQQPPPGTTSDYCHLNLRLNEELHNYILKKKHVHNINFYWQKSWQWIKWQHFHFIFAINGHISIWIETEKHATRKRNIIQHAGKISGRKRDNSLISNQFFTVSSELCIFTI